MMTTVSARRAFPLCGSLILAIAFGGPAALADDAVPGIEVGKPAPPFTLPDASGKKVSLRELTADGNVAIVFYRSADW